MRHLNLVIAMATAGLLVACGGSPSESTPAPSGSSSLSLSGVVAKGAALAGATVTAKCAAGTASPATTSGTGTYSLTITGGVLPCVLEATGTGADAGLVLHSVATGSGSSATSNVTPVTELLVAQLTGQDPATFMAAADATSLNSTVTTTNINAAKTEVIATLTAAGLDTAALASADMVSGTLAAGTGAGYDGVLDALGAALTSSGTTLAQLTETVVNTAGGSGPGTEVAAPASALPANLLLRPKAANCDALRSTSYRIIKIAASNGAATAPSTAYEDMSFNADTLTATFSPNDTMAFTANGTCRYTLPEGEAVVSPAGVIVIRHMVGADDDTVGTGDRGVARMMIALPVQDLSVADLAGEYAFLGVDRNPLAAYGGYATVTASGAVNAFRCWEDALSVAEAACTPIDSGYAEALSKNSNGSFTWAAGAADPDQWSDTVYAYRAGNGDVLLVGLTDSGEPTIGVKRRVLTLPSVGDTYANWSMHVDGNLVAAAVTTSVSHTVASVDAATSSIVRTSVEVGAGTTSQTLAYNSGRAGYLNRPAGTGVRPFTGLAAPGFGLSALFLPAHNGQVARFSLSARQ
ncbi:hypothetical protein [Piscinibacter gummiphilus]|uniref:Lipoprotein n=1 Tax=Piscinibacter gummiphilus TaxID=946333 RepID=A0ABZ0CTK6_9BURK|nr:hypothetical protein [Piscinibacter gummiphilus]WOB08302.1 hypothetical protein RXV79_25815 [Piscinibacter gummiphilus]